MIRTSFSRSGSGATEGLPIGMGRSATSQRETSRYDHRLTGWARVMSFIAPIAVFAGLGSLFLFLGGNELVRKAEERSLNVFSVSLPPPLSERAPPAPPVKTPPITQPQQPSTQTPIAITTPVVAAPVLASMPVAVAATQPMVATSTATSASADSAPAFVSNPMCSIATPTYPTRAKRLQQTGSVRVAVTIDSTGRIVDETVRKSSGYEALDAAALATVRSGRCRASADGRPINSILSIGFTLDQ